MNLKSRLTTAEGWRNVRSRECCRCRCVLSCAAQIANYCCVVNATFARIIAGAALSCAALLGTGLGPGAAQTPVALELVLAVDTSTSVDKAEFALQQTGFAEAFRHPDVIRAIEQAGDGGIAVTLVQWSGRGQQRTSVDWTRVRNGAEAQELAGRIGRSRRLMSGFTDIAGAIGFSLGKFQDNGFQGRRRVIDVSGDGTSNGSSAAAARDAAIASA